MISIYFDVCCLNRQFDDQTQERVYLEANAVASILRHMEAGDWVSVSSEAVEDEVDSDSNIDRKARVQEFIALSKRIVTVKPEHISRAIELQRLGFHDMDALHVACAESAEVDVFLTTDDRLLRLALRVKEQLLVRVANPVVWLLEVNDGH